MMLSILSLVFWALAAVCNAAMDIVSHHYYQSIFHHRNKGQYYNPVYSWKNKYNCSDPDLGRKRWFWGLLTVHPAFTDFWHLMKSSMIVCLAFSVTFMTYSDVPFKWYNILAVVGLYGLIWNLVFNVFYNNIFRK